MKRFIHGIFILSRSHILGVPYGAAVRLDARRCPPLPIFRLPWAVLIAPQTVVCASTSLGTCSSGRRQIFKIKCF